jgi:hypothetical protein
MHRHDIPRNFARRDDVRAIEFRVELFDVRKIPVPPLPGPFEELLQLLVILFRDKDVSSRHDYSIDGPASRVLISDSLAWTLSRTR